MLVKFPFSNELKTIFKLVNKEDSIRIVGGCVRDFLSKDLSQDSNTSSLYKNSKSKDQNYHRKEICDIDLACKYTPQKTMSLLKKDSTIKIVPIGIKHGTIAAIINGKTFEITTLRKDVENYGRKAKVEFIDDFKQDAQRRDFTINAMSIDEDGKLFDYFGGFDDLRNNRVKFIGDAKLRIEEDYLRILRFFRFSCYYSNKVDKLALEEVVKLKKNITDLSSHRIRSELIKIIQCSNNKRLLEILSLMKDKEILQEILLFNDLDLVFLENLFKFSDFLSQEQDFLIKFCALIFSQEKQNLKISNYLEFSNKDKKYINTVLNLSKEVDLDIKKTDLLKILFNFEKNLVISALKINIITNFKNNKPNLSKFLEIRDYINEIKLPNFIINGHDLKEIGIKAKNIGIILKELQNLWIDSNFKLSKSKLLNLVHNTNIKG